MTIWLWRDDEPGPFMLHDRSGGGLLVWRDDLGNYTDAQGCILAFGALV